MTILLGVAAALLLWGWVLLVPGYAVSRLLDPARLGAERLLSTLICAFSVVPLGYFLVALALSAPADAGLYLVLSSAINAGALARAWQVRDRLTPDLGRRHAAALAATGAAALALLLFGTRHLDGGDIFNTLQHCLYVIVMHTVANDPSWSVPLFDFLSGQPLHVLVSHTTDGLNGLAPLFHEQRLGNAAILAPHVALLGMAGWLTASVHAYVLVALAGWCVCRRIGVRPWAAGVAVGLFVVGMNTFLGYVVNENVFATAIVAFLLWSVLAFEGPNSRGHVTNIVLIGVLSGHLIGVRHTSALFWPAVAAGLWWAGPGAVKRLLLAGGLAILATVPWLWVNLQMLGNPFAHPKVIGDSDGRLVTNTLWSLSFRFKALNWPFADGGLVRTPWNPFPTVVWLPLMLSRCFGQVAVAIGLVGGWASIKKATSRRTLVLLLLFSVPHSLAIAWLELLDWEQLSYATPGLFPFVAFLGLGIDRLADRATWKGQAGRALAVLVVIVGLSYALRLASFPVDRRGLDAEQWAEAPPSDAGTEALKLELTAFHPLPRMPVLRTRVAAQLASSFASIVDRPDVPVQDGRPVYPSGQVAILSGYAEDAPRHYRFLIDGEPERTGREQIRSAVGLHTVMLRLPSPQVDVTVTRHQGNYDVAVRTMGRAEPTDFTFYINPWRPALRELNIRVDGQRVSGLRLLPYGGRADDGEELLIATNYPREVVDTVAVPYRVELADERSVFCGLFLFVTRHGGDDIETLVLAGGHVAGWHGQLRGNLILPRGLGTSEVILFNEPYCSTHVPQFGDRYGRAILDEESELTFRLDGRW